MLYIVQNMNNVRKLLENSNITKEWPALASRISYDELMSAHTTFKIGGPADCFARPRTRAELSALIDFFTANTIPVSVLGGGSNLLVADRGIRGAVISLAGFDAIERIDSTPPAAPDALLVRSGAGVAMNDLVEWCAARSFGGLERFAGLPGSVGGAVFMNARCYETSVSDVFFRAECLYFRDGGYTIEERPFDPAEWDYKRSPFQWRSGPDPLLLGENAQIVLSAVLHLKAGDERAIRSEMETYVRDRACKGHFRYPSAGSMFKNDRAFGKPSGKIIDEAGLCGLRIGDAQIAPWHGNILVNVGNATASDVRALVDEVRRQVLEKTGFDLEPEVIMAGDW